MQRLITPPASSQLEILNIVVSDGTDAITGASVTIDDSVVVTDENGAASFDLEYGDYTCTVSKTGYESVTESLSFRSNHKNFSITLTESGGGGGGSTLTVTVKGVPSIGADPIIIEGADVSLVTSIPPSSDPIATGQSGQDGTVSLTADYGTYYIVGGKESEGYQVESPVEVTLSEETQTITITLTKML